MRNPIPTLENYPCSTVLLFTFVNLSIYFCAAYLLYLAWPILVIPFVLYLLYLEVSVYQKSCVHCYYYGKVCAFGRGKLAPKFLKKGDPQKFCEKTVSFKDFIPSSLPTIIPLIAGIYLLTQSFSWFILLLTLWPPAIMFLGNPLIYGKVACRRCKQAELCCPTSEFFLKRTGKGKSQN